MDGADVRDQAHVGVHPLREPGDLAEMVHPALDGRVAVLFGEPEGKNPFAWVFSGHHLTLRCDGNSEPGVAWGGPIYYGHSVAGYDKNNVYLYQTEQVQTVFDSLNEKQRAKSMATRCDGWFA